MMTTISFGRNICNDLSIAETKEWLVTNGIGGYASGTVANLLTRRYHGLLVAALKPPLGRTLLAAKLDEMVAYQKNHIPLFANRWAAGAMDPHGYCNIERFYLEGAVPVWVFAFADALLEKRIWMQPGANTTYVSYRLIRATSPFELNVKALVNYRDFHGETQSGDWRMDVRKVAHGLSIHAFEQAVPFYIFSDRAKAEIVNKWYRGFSLKIEQYRGFTGLDDHLNAGEFSVSLTAGETVTFILSTDASPNLDGTSAYAEHQTYENGLIARITDLPPQLVLAADQFIVKRAAPDQPDGRSIIAGYPWFGDWGRDTMISLPSLTLATGRANEACEILRTFAKFVDQGMLPNRFPDEGEAPEYNTVDATLWYFEAIRAYYQETGDNELLKELFPVLKEIIDWHERGTRYQIHVDPADGLLYAGEDGVQLTWMDAKLGDWVVTPRIGKPVEINALWYNALRSMAEFARVLDQTPSHYDDLAERARISFSRFWDENTGYCYDVLDSPQGDDLALRPNQLLAVSLRYCPLNAGQQKSVVDVCARRLLTSHGLRSLAPEEPGYIGHYGGSPHERDGAYHQGTVWSWLIGPFVSAHLRVYKDPRVARSFLEPFFDQLSEHGVGTISEIFDGDAPFSPRGCIAQAWSVAELLRVWREIAVLESSLNTL
ncbi:MAG: amylo-alpha-1,6-glucosidase [Chloroflexi bacterium]|nr:amylo-alpha-1,6-glucosidase [Chloroflexota bacterium]